MYKIRTADDLRKEMGTDEEPHEGLVDRWLEWLDKNHFDKLKHNRGHYVSWQTFPRIRTPLSSGRISASRKRLIETLCEAGFEVSETHMEGIDAGLQFEPLHR